MARTPVRPTAPLTLEERLALDLVMTGGQMPLVVVVADDRIVAVGNNRISM